MDFIDYALFFKLLLIVGVVFIFPYREADWNAYMEVTGIFLDGELNYGKLKSKEMSLDCPGGLVWIYSALYYITKAGKSISLAQMIFSGMYLVTFGMVLSLYLRAEFPWWVTIPLFVSPRVLNTYSLSFSNDCWAMFFLYSAITLFACGRYWKLGCFLYTMAVSVKASLLLLAPGLLYVLLRSLSFFKVLNCLVVCILWQLVVVYPFILDDWRSYTDETLELRSVFASGFPEIYQLFKKLICTLPYQTLMFLAIIVVSWLLLWWLRWSRRWRISVNNEETEVGRCEKFHERDSGSGHMIVLTLFESNLVGALWAILFQCDFYTSFFHMLPYILHSIEYPNWLRCVVLGLIVQAFEISPSACGHSILLITGNILLMLGILFFENSDNVGGTLKKEAAKVRRDKSDPNVFPKLTSPDVCERMG